MRMASDYLLNDRRSKEAREARDLASFAVHSAASLGRRWAEEPDPLRTCFERDRDRVVHSTAFRRLMYKTQVFVNSEGDQYRTRMSHSLEVCQVARSVANVLCLNEPLCEALALAHDIGHPPFGHRGEWALDELMRGHDGFRHNAQVLRVVDLLERRSPEHPGLNLTREVRESLLKHESERDWPAEFDPRPASPLLEAQVVDLADSTAYDKHDIEDGLFARMFTEEDLYAGSELWRRCCDSVEARHPGFLAATNDRKLRVARVANELIGSCIVDIVQCSADRVAAAGVRNPEEARGLGRMLVGHGAEMKERVGELQRFLHENFYRHAYLQLLREYALRVLSALFHAYRDRPSELSAWYRGWADEVGLERAVCDYLAT
jgi:dGTPase